MTIAFNDWAASVDGKYIDKDGYGDPIWQCHDVWLDYLVRVAGGTQYMGYAPTDYTDSVFTHFPVNGVDAVFTKHPGTAGMRKGDVVFWPRWSSNHPLSHVAIALGEPAGGRVLCMTQNPGATHQEHLSLANCLGYLRPKNSPGEDMPLSNADVQRVAEATATMIRHHQRENGVSPNGSSGRTLFDLGQQSADGLTDKRAASFDHHLRNSFREKGFGWQNPANGRTIWEVLKSIESKTK